MKVNSLDIKRYKSIRHLGLDCQKINIFIGKPNTGKSNLLEALGLFALFNNECRITDLVRFETLYNLFHDNNIEHPVEIQTDKHRVKILLKENFEIYVETRLKTSIKNYDLYYDSTGKLLNPNPHYTSPVKFYKFRPDNYYYNKSSDFLRPPHGENLVIMLLKNRDLRQQIGELYSPYGFKFVINPQDSSVSLQKEEDGIMVSYPYTLGSSTLQRYIFHLAALETNKESIIVIDEPEAASSTEFTRQLADKIAKDETNQFFLSTHSPHLLLCLLEKAPNSVNLFYTYFEDYETKVQQIDPAEYKKIAKRDKEVYNNMEEFISSSAR